MKKISLDCPKCGASLEISDEIDVFYCTYCGEKISTGDKERIKAQLKVKKMEFEERKDKRDNRFMGFYFIGLFVLMLAMLVAVVIGDSHDKKLKMQQMNAGNIEIERSNRDMAGDYYKDVLTEFEDKGFSNVQAIEMDKKAPLLKKPGDVDRVLISGETDYNIGDYVSSDAPIKIYYYNLEK